MRCGSFCLSLQSRACYKLRISNDNRRMRKMFYAFHQREPEHSDVHAGNVQNAWISWEWGNEEASASLIIRISLCSGTLWDQSHVTCLGTTTIFVTLDHKTSLKSGVYLIAKNTLHGQNYRFFFMPKIIGILSKDHDPWRYFVHFLP